ncbi:MAG: T9SS type A sorting domain-containing protein [Melioribacteraceae bacterium]|nr:T9SS type A sorting domain-containing protein [Melioribacteraceae bacterium]
MKKFTTILISSILLFLSSSLFAQVLFSDNFESGTASAEWGVYRAGEETVTAVPMGDAPKALSNGGNYVGYLQDSDGTYTGAAIALAGDVSAANYNIEADVYCYVNNANGSAYTGVTFYSDSTRSVYLKLVADFDGSQRMRLYNNRLNMTTFQYTFHHQFGAADMPNGIPTEDGWHKMRVEVRTINEDTTAFWSYFDGVLLNGSPVYDTGDDRMASGKFGLFSFQQGETGIAGYYDNVVVTEVSAETDNLFADDFESGTASTEWGVYRAGEETVTAVPMGDAPSALDGGGDYVGYLQDSDGTYTGAAIALAGDVDETDYSIEADVYCYVNNPNGSAYTGVTFYSDSTKSVYLKLVADFDGSQRMRLYNNRLNMTTFQYTFHHQFDAADMPNGIPTADGWYKIKVEVRTINEDTTAFWSYFDGVLLNGSPIYDTGVDRMASGKFGLFSFQQGETGIPGYFDNVVVKKLDAITSVKENREKINTVPEGFVLEQNYPNPFNPSTVINFSISESALVTLKVFNMLGQEVAELVNSVKSAGSYSATFDAANLPTGLYVYTIRVDNYTATKKMLLIK